MAPFFTGADIFEPDHTREAGLEGLSEFQKRFNEVLVAALKGKRGIPKIEPPWVSCSSFCPNIECTPGAGCLVNQEMASAFSFCGPLDSVHY